jgi:hypothetical protein
MKHGKLLAVALGLACASLLGVPGAVRAADHGDSPNVAGQQAGDLADTYVFLDPNDATRLVVIQTFRGFIVPGEAVNFAVFDHTALYRLDIENTGDARPDQTIEVTFSPKGTSGSDPQTATVKLSGRPRREFTAPTTVATLSPTPNAPTITTDPGTNITFFAGEVDDPFFFDLVGFQRFAASVRAGSADPTTLQRGRDVFAGYNILCFALSIPVDLVRGDTSNNVVGVQGVALEKGRKFGRGTGVIRGTGRGSQIDRCATPGVNALLIPYGRKNEHNAGSPVQDATGQFAGDLVALFQAFGTNQANIDALAGIVVTDGDYVRVNVTTPNTGPGGGTNAEGGFPNGRRPGDDVVDTTLTIIANGTDLGDAVDANDVAFRDTFPFLAPPQQPLDTGVVDDNTRN